MIVGARIAPPFVHAGKWMVGIMILDDDPDTFWPLFWGVGDTSDEATAKAREFAESLRPDVRAKSPER